MPKFNSEDFHKGPVLIKIERCPRTKKTELCSEECTEQCIKKSYTIFDPKPPRQYLKRKMKIPPPVTYNAVTSNRIMQETIEYLPEMAQGEIITPQPKTSASQIEASAVEMPNETDIKVKSEEIQLEKSEESIQELQEEMANTLSEKPASTTLSIKMEEENTNTGISQMLLKGATESQEPVSYIFMDYAPPKSQPVPPPSSQLNDIEEAEIADKNSFSSEPLVINSPIVTSSISVISPSFIPQRYHGSGCTLEICISEKHDEQCKLWKESGTTGDSKDGYHVTSRKIIKICGSSPTISKTPQECKCQKLINENQVNCCPVCSSCPCHRQKKTPFSYKAPKQLSSQLPILPMQPELESLSELSEPDSYVESISSYLPLTSIKALDSTEMPNFREMSLIPESPQGKFPGLFKCFRKSKSKKDKSSKKDNSSKKGLKISEEDCPQCPDVTK